MNEEQVTKAEELRDAMREDGIPTEPKAIHVKYILDKFKLYYEDLPVRKPEVKK